MRKFREKKNNKKISREKNKKKISGKCGIKKCNIFAKIHQKRQKISEHKTKRKKFWGELSRSKYKAT